MRTKSSLPSESSLTPRHTSARKHDSQRVASYHFGSDTRWGCTERHCQHCAYCHVRVAISHPVTSALSLERVPPRRIVLTQTTSSDTCSLGSFAEIIPQSVCTRHGLYIGAKMVFFVRILLCTLVRLSIIVRCYVSLNTVP
jgi:hypothetical protein